MLHKTAKYMKLHAQNTIIYRGFVTQKNLKLNNSAKISDAEILPEPTINASFMARKVGAFYIKWSKILEKHPPLKSLKPVDVENSVRTLKALNYTTDHIVSAPMILNYNALTLENRYNILLESGIDPVAIIMLLRYITVLNRSILILKSHRHITVDLDVEQKLLNILADDMDVADMPTINRNIKTDNKTLRQLREEILRGYLRQRIGANDSNLNKIYKIYPHVRHKSFHNIKLMLKLLQNELNFSNERIIKNGFLLHAEPQNVARILKEIKTIDGVDIREIVHRRPKLLMSQCDSLLKTLEHITSFGINESAILRCIEVLTLGPDTIYERLHELNEIDEFKVLNSNPRILRLVHYQNKARLRLDYLNQLKVRCASLHILSCSSEAFAKFARDGTDKTKGCDTIVYLAKIMQKDENDLRVSISRHANWCQTPALQVKNCYEMLRQKNFSDNEIYLNIHILLYPIKRIEEKISQIQTRKFFNDLKLNLEPEELTNCQMLTLILYLIEYEFHFTGDGIWTEHQTQQVENFNNLLPDFPESVNKVYKYGMKPKLKPVVETSR